ASPPPTSGIVSPANETATAAALKSSQTIADVGLRIADSLFVIGAFVTENVKYHGNDSCIQMSEIRDPQSAKCKLRAAAIGVGSLGRHHARNYTELSSEGRVEFVGVCDVDPETRTKVAEDNGLDA